MPKVQQTALITGASSGIGAAFARQLAEEGYSLVLVARRREKLEQMAEELENRYEIKVEIVSADLSTDEGIEAVEKKAVFCETLELLINNAGFGTHGHFVEVDIKKHTGMMEVHNTATVRLCHAALPGMIRRGKGSIINMASVGGFLAYPHNSIYGASKAFNDFFSRALASELKGSGIKVQSLCPGMTYSEFHDLPEFKDFERSQVPAAMWMKAEKVVELSLKSLRNSGRVTFIPGLLNRMLKFFGNLPFFSDLLAGMDEKQPSRPLTDLPQTKP